MNFLRHGTGIVLFLTASMSGAAAPQGDILVRFDPGAPVTALARRYGLQAHWSSKLVPGLQSFKVARDANLPDTLRRIAREPGVRYAEINQVRVQEKLMPARSVMRSSRIFGGLIQAPNDPLNSSQWSLMNPTGLHPEGAWAITQGSPQITVAVIDTGSSAGHADLKGTILPGYDFIDNKATVVDTHGHGTHVSGTIAAHSNNGVGITGLAPDTRILPIRAVPNEDDETDENVIKAFEFAVEHGARVANCSFGKADSGQAVGDAIAEAGKHGLFVVAAAGNDGEDLNNHPSYPGDFRTPNMIVVASTNVDNEMSYFSNYGRGHVDIGAPGEDILSTFLDDKYVNFSGTSMATPHVVGVVALMLAANPALTPEQIRKILMETVDPTPDLQNTVDSGGKVNATRAVQAAAAFQGQGQG
ncbi:MAG: S8 family serine peptidase [Bdellovibrionales bacterium]|nr:S8 family serine peptidase [Bdellovibrionales bacterium]